MKSGMLAEPILVGREHELEELQHYLDSAVEGKGSTVFISGEAGSGKTRLVTEFLNGAKKQGVSTLTGWCLSNAAVPYFPFFEAFNVYFSGERGEENKLNGNQPLEPQIESNEPKRIGPEESEVTTWLMGPAQAEKLGKPQAISPQVWKDQTFAAVAKTLAAISARKPTVLFIDDVHWADSASLALIHYIARTINSEKVLVLAAYRSEQLTPDAEGRPHPLVETLRLMRREELLREIKVANLNQTCVSDLARNMLGGDVQLELAEKLAGESQGNPLFVVESLRMLHERGGLVREADQWRLSAGAFGIPPKIKDIILQRLNVLLRDQRRVLDAASVIGEKFKVELLASVLGIDWLEVIETLNVIEKSTSLVCYEGELYRFDHARYRDAIYDEVSPGLKRGYHDRVAEKLEGMSKGGKPPFSEIAHHYAQAGNKEKAMKYALAAGQDALARWSNTEAIKHFSYVVEAVGEDPKRAEERLSAMEGLGDAFYANSMLKEATATFELLGDVGLGVVRLRAYRKAMESAFQLGDASRLMEVVKKAEPYAAADRLEYARVLMSRDGVSHLQSNFLAAIKISEEGGALQVFEEEYSLWDVARALVGLGGYHAFFGRVKEGFAESLRAVALFEELGDFPMQMEACWVASLAFREALLLREALGLLAKVIEINEKMKMGDYLRLVYANGFSSRCFWLMGDFKEALACSLKALEFSKKTDSIMAHGVVYSSLTQLYTILGDMKRAEEYFEKLMKLPPEILHHGLVIGQLAMAVFFAGKNQWEESNRAFKELFERLKNLPGVSLALLGEKEVYAWALERQGRFEEAMVQLEECRKIRREAEARFEHADLQAHLIVRRQVVAGEESEMRLDLVNVGRKPALLVKVENVLLDDFKVIALPSWCSLQDGSVEMKNREIGAFQVESVKLGLKGLKAGTFTLAPQAVYVDDLGETKTCRLNTVNITVRQAPPKVRPGRVSSGMAELDDLLLGGIPEKYSVILTAASSDERELFINRFLETAVQAGQTTLYLTTEAGNAEALAETFQANFFLFLCSPQAELMTEKLPNIYRLKGVDNLTEIDIALAKHFRTLDPSKGGPRIACIKIVSDVLLQHHAVITRKWLSSLLANLKSKSFTTLAVIDPRMHAPEEAQAILGLFDGEIRMAEKEGAKGLEKTLKILRLYNQNYLKDELTIGWEKIA